MSDTTHLIGFRSTWDSRYELAIRAVNNQVGTQPDGIPITKPSEELEIEVHEEGKERNMTIYLDRYDIFELIAKLNEWYHQ